MLLVRIVKDWDYPDLLRQTPGGKGIWDGIRFTLEPAAECDFLVMLNNRMTTDTRAVCPPKNVWALMQEPYQKGLTDWMVEKHERFHKVLTHFPPENTDKYVVSHPAIPWHVNRNFDELAAMKLPEKPKALSWVVGDARDLPGHIKRWAFLESIRRQDTLPVDLYGRAVKYIEDKFDGLAPYRYSLAVENTSSPDYWTEKVADCFLTWTVPIYAGCPNLDTYFPEDAFIRIDMERPGESIEKIRAVIREDNWERRLPALGEARRRVLYRYQIFPHLAGLIRAQGTVAAKRETVWLPAYRRSLTASINRIGYKLKKKLHRL